MILTDESDRRLDGEKHPRMRANIARERLCNHRREGLIWSEKWTAAGKEKWFRSLLPINLALASATLIVAKRVASLLSRQKLGASHLALGGGCFRRRWRHPRRLPKSIGVFPKRTVRSDPLEQAAGLAPLIRDRVSTRCMFETMNENMPSTLSLLVHASDFNLACTNNRWPRVYALFETKFADSTMNTLNSSMAQHHALWTKRNIETKGWCLAREFVCSFALIGKDTRVHP